MTNDKQTITLVLVAAAVGASYLVADHLRTPFDANFEDSARRHKVDPNLLRAIAKKESGMKPNAVGPLNANGSRDYGLMQLNDVTLKALGRTTEEALTPGPAIDIAAGFLARLRGELGAKLTAHTLVAAYNAGSPAILRRGIFNMPYVADVMNHYQLYALGRSFA